MIQGQESLVINVPKPDLVAGNQDRGHDGILRTRPGRHPNQVSMVYALAIQRNGYLWTLHVVLDWGP